MTTSLRRALLLSLLAFLPVLALAATPAAAPRPGIDFAELPVPAPTYGQGKIEVAEVFSYACIHCAHFQPLVDAWKKTQPKDVRWEYVPADFGPVWNTFARAYFAADQMHILAASHAAVFKAIHEEHALSAVQPEDVAGLYAGRFGVDAAKFLAAMNSPATETKVNAARQFALASGIDGTPTIVIDGKYRVTATADRGFPGMLATVDYLVAQERAAKQKAGAPARKP